MKSLARRVLYVFFVISLLYPLYKTVKASHHELPLFALLVPDGNEANVGTEVWKHAAREVGIPLQVISDQQLLAPFEPSHQSIRAILVPDSVSNQAPATLIAYLLNYVTNGGKLILVGNAFSENADGRLLENFPLETYFHFPKVLDRKGDTLQYAYEPIHIRDEWKARLKFPPGSYSPSEAANPKAPFRVLGTYQQNSNPYPHWKTTPASEFKGTSILESESGSLIAGINKIGKGQVLWINLPLSYLKRRTDGLLLNSFLRWISEDWVGLPRLLPVPDGIGGMIMNIHVDSNAAVAGLNLMKKMNLFDTGPFSIHVTAGPDTRVTGDGLGFNLPGNTDSQNWIKYWVKKGHEVGSHGGWIHDYFGLNVTTHSNPEMVRDLELNVKWIEKFSGAPVREYSAPVGNHPVWMTNWIREHGFNSYYFTGNSGMGPVQNFRDDVFTDLGLWSFPIAAFQQVASFEEADQKKISRIEMEEWLKALTHFVTSEHESRLFYFHPPGLQAYSKTFKDWIDLNETFKESGKFQWYTMNELSQFLLKRDQSSWSVERTERPGKLKLSISATDDSTKLVWILLKKNAVHAELVSGDAQISEHEDEVWVQPRSKGLIVIKYDEVMHEF